MCAFLRNDSETSVYLKMAKMSDKGHNDSRNRQGAVMRSFDERN